jgi:uroporphyrinogen decarboxylase
MIKNSEHLFIRALRGEKVERPPVWMMRQAGRYLPEYMELRRKYDFFTRVETPELACEITLQPIDIVQPDAAIIFSDILVIPQAMGLEVQLVPKIGPLLPQTVSSKSDIDGLDLDGIEVKLKYMFDALSLTKRELNNRVPLIGFAGAPWTLMCYMIEGQGSKTFSKAKAFLYQQEEQAHRLLDILADYIIAFLKLQIQAGADVVQVFDSWSGLLSPDDFMRFEAPRLKRIVQEVKEFAPTILFAKGSWYALEEMSSYGAALGLDWTMDPKWAREQTGKTTLQGNLDPCVLLGSMSSVEKATRQMLDKFGTQRYVANLGHGLMPNIPVENVKTFVQTVKNYGQ